MIRIRQNFKIKPEMVGGSVPLSEMEDWMAVLSEQPNGFTDAEKQEFFENHLATKISECIDNGMTEEETVKEVIRELSSGHDELSIEIIGFVRLAVATIFDKINN